MASNAHRGAKLDFDDLQSRKGYIGFPRLFQVQALQHPVHPRTGAAHHRQRRHRQCLHPGFVATRFGDQSGGLMRTVLTVAKPIGAISPEEGAKTIIYLASSPEVAMSAANISMNASSTRRRRKRATTQTRESCGRFRKA